KPFAVENFGSHDIPPIRYLPVCKKQRGDQLRAGSLNRKLVARGKGDRTMKVGIPRERKTLEKRVALTPDGAQKLVSHGHQVLLETGAGDGAGYSDSEYEAAGARIVSTLAEVWQGAELVVKVKEPHESEYEYFRPGLVLFDYLHLASMPDV